MTVSDPPPSVSLSTARPTVGRPARARLANAGDGASEPVWRWSRSGNASAAPALWAAIAGARDAGYTPTAADEGWFLRATASYRDGGGARRQLAAATPDAVADRPNVVLIMADDIGYESFGAYGSTQYRTPRIDALAAQGTRFTNAYARPRCSPSRVALMTGRSNVRNYVDWSVLPAGEYTIADLFGDAGYATAMAGKWQLHGIREFKGVAAANAGFGTYCLWHTATTVRKRYWNPSVDCDGQLHPGGEDVYGPDVFTDFMLDFIEANRETPFFAYYAMVAPHFPLDRSPPVAQCADESDEQCNYEDIVAYLDRNVGRIQDKLAAEGLLNRTILVFLSDNGSYKRVYSDLGGERIYGAKGTTLDAGSRVPLIVRVPDGDGRVLEDLVDITDILPTLAAGTGLTLPEDTVFDGVPFWDRLTGGAGNPRQSIYTYYFPQPYAEAFDNPHRHPETVYARDTRYKLYGTGELYDTSADPNEVAALAPQDEGSRAARAKLRGVLDGMPAAGAGISWTHVVGQPVDGELRPRWRPALASARVVGAELTLTFAGRLTRTIDTPPSSFAVRVDGVTREVSAVRGETPSVTLTLAMAVKAGESVTVGYAPGENAIRHANREKDGDAPAFADVAVTNETEASDDVALEALALSGIDIGTFSAETTTYRASVDRSVATTTVEATSSDANAQVTITPADADADAAGHQVALARGSNEISIEVTAEDGETVRAYAVTVMRVFPPLTASFDVLPESHSGVPFGLRARFSEPIATSFRALRDDGFEVTHGEVTLANRVDRRSDLWNVVVDPTAAQDIVVTLPAATDCAAAGAACTADGRGLSHGLAATVTAAADARVPVVSVSSASETGAEGDRIAFTVSRTGIKAFGTLTANLELTVTGGEERYRSHTVNLGHRREALLLLGLTDDRVVREAVTVVRTVLPGEGYGVSAESGTAQTVLEDDDVAEFAVTAPSRVAEGASAAIRVSTTNGVTFGTDQTIALTASGSATAGEDYRLPSETALAAETATASVTLEALRDGVDEEPETVTVAAMHAGAAIGSVSLTIEAAASTLSAAFENVPDTHDGEAAFPFGLRFSGEVAISYVTLRDASFELTNGAVRKAERLSPPSNIAWRITVEPTADGDITIRLPARSDCSAAGAVCTAGGTALSNSATATVAGPAGPAEPEVSIAAAAARVAEGAAAEFALTLGQAAASALTVSVGVAEDGSMLSGAPPASVSIAVGETAATLRVATADDAVVEADSAVTATLAAGTGYALGEAAASATVTVEDDDEASFSVSAAPSEIAEGGDATVTVAISNEARFADARTIALAVSGTASVSDYELAPSLTLAAGSSAATATLTAVADEEEEGSETATVTARVDGAAVGSAAVSIRDASDDASLAALELSDVDIGAFDAEVTAYAAEVAHAIESTTVEATPADADASVEITDATGGTLGTRRTSALAQGANEIAARVTAEDGATRRTYAVTVTRAAVPAWGARLPGRDIALADASAPSGVWSDGEIVWVSDIQEGVLAYALSDGARLPGRDVDVAAVSRPTGLWSDGATLWVADYDGGVRAYRLADGDRLSNEDLDADVLTAAGNVIPTGLWSDGANLLVADNADGRAYAYALSDGGRVEDAEFSLRGGDLRNMQPYGLWSDGETLLASHWTRGWVRGYRLSDGARRSARDIKAHAQGNSYPRGLWSDGETLWVVDYAGRKLYAYAAPGLRRDAGVLPELVLANRAAGVPGTDPGARVSIPDAGLRARVGAALGKAPGDVIGANELAALTALDARDAGVADLAGLERAVNLEGLDLGLNPLVDLRALESLPALRTLNLDGTSADPWALAALARLERLSLRDNGIEELDGLSSLTALRVLDVGGNRIADLSPLAGLASLTALRADDNVIVDVSSLGGLGALVELDVRGNRIADFSALEGNEGLRVIGRTGQGALLESR